MTKPKTETQKQRDRMGRMHNKINKLIEQSNLDMPETYVVIDNVRHSLLVNLRKATGQE